MIEYTKLKEHKRHNLRDVIPLNRPYTVLIEPSNFCNFKCIQCFQSIRSETYFSKSKGLMDMDLYKNIINQIQEWDGEKIKVLKLGMYGEPFTNKNFCEMLKIARNSNQFERIETTTNASLLTKDICEKLVEYKIDYIRVSIYASNQEKYKEITKSNADMNEIIETLKYIKKLKEEKGLKKPFISAKMLDTYSEENNEFIEIFKPIADEVYIDKPHNWVAHEEKSFIGSLYGEEKKKNLEFDLDQTKSDRQACPMPFTTIAIRNNGDISPCCVDWIGETNLGNIKDISIKEIWNGEVMYQFRKMQLENRRYENKSCKSCGVISNDYYTRDNIDGFPVEKLK